MPLAPTFLSERGIKQRDDLNLGRFVFAFVPSSAVCNASHAMLLAASKWSSSRARSLAHAPPLVVVVEVGVGGLVVERQVGGAGEPGQRHVRLPGALLEG